MPGPGLCVVVLCLAAAGCAPASDPDAPTVPGAAHSPGASSGSESERPTRSTIRRQGESKGRDSRALRVPVEVLPALPEPGEVAEVVLTVRPPVSADREIVIGVSDPSRIALFLGQLGAIDWNQRGIPLAEIGMIAPDLTLTVYEVKGIHRDYAFYWGQAGLIDNVTGRLLEIDVPQLRLVVGDELLLVAAEAAKSASREAGAASPRR